MRGYLGAIAVAVAAITPMALHAQSPPPKARFDYVTYDTQNLPPPVAADRYRNPVLPGFQPDPSVVRVGDDFYLVNSTFAWFPGIPVYHSRDLVNWRQIGNAIDRPDMLDMRGLSLNRGVFAPTIQHHGDLFYILNTCIGCKGNFILTATDPAGPWSDPHWLDFGGIDPSLFVDDDGRAYITYNDAPPGPPEYDGHRALWQQQIDLKTFAFVGARTLLVDKGVDPSTKPVWAEGPHIYKVDRHYYLMPAEGGTADQHAETIYRSDAVSGPYRPGPVNPILTQRDLPENRPNPVQATGHADLVQLKNGDWWAVFLATRPFRGQETLLGRETFLLPVSWPKGGWPQILPPATPLPETLKRPALPRGKTIGRARWTDSFAGNTLAPDWLMLRTPKGEPWWSLTDTPGALTLTARSVAAGSLDQPAYLGRRLRHGDATYATRVRFDPQAKGDRAGLLAVGDENHFLFFGIEQVGNGRSIVARRRISGATSDTGLVIGAVPVAGSGPVDLEVRFTDGIARLRWRVSERGGWQILLTDVDVSMLASIHAGQFMGLVVGPHAARAEP